MKTIFACDESPFSTLTDEFLQLQHWSQWAPSCHSLHFAPIFVALQSRRWRHRAPILATRDDEDLAARSTNGRFFRLPMQREAAWADSGLSLQMQIDGYHVRKATLALSG